VAWQTDALAQINLERSRDYAIAPVDLASRLASSLRLNGAPQPRLDNQKDERWASDLAVWVVAQAEQARSRAWVVLDGFDPPDLPPATHVFIATLAEEAVCRDALRLVLIGYNRRLHDDIERKLHRVSLDYLSAADLKMFFDDLDVALGYRSKPACQKFVAAADLLLQYYAALPRLIPTSLAPGLTRLLSSTSTSTASYCRRRNPRHCYWRRSINW
jgi:hypothetical protein